MANICLATQPATIVAVSSSRAVATVLVDSVLPVLEFSSSTVTLVPVSARILSWIRRGFGQIVPKNWMIAPARPAAELPVASAMVASSLVRLPPGSIAGEPGSPSRTAGT